VLLVNVYHHNEETDKIEIIVDETPVNEDNKASESCQISANATSQDELIDDTLEDGDIINDVTVEGETGSFSQYTVDFVYNEKIVSIYANTDKTSLTTLLSWIGIHEVV